MIIDGKAVSEEILEDVEKRVDILKDKGIEPTLAIVLVGNNAASRSYVNGKQRALDKTGMRCKMYELPELATESELLELICELNKDEFVHGILVQLPLPDHISENNVIEAIAPEKDVDGFTPINVGNLVLGRDCFLPCTPHGIIELIKKTGIETSGKHAVVIGRSNIVGKPISMLLARKGINCTVTICHTGTKNLEDFTKTADILVVAAGRPGTVTGDMIKEGAVVIDVGVNRIGDSTKKSGYRLVGDVDFESAKDKAAFITPVPGGVGPMTIAMLMQNTVEAAERC